jgi:hypothetical protein
MPQIRGASQINDDEFLRSYNNPALSNAEMLAELSTDWTAIGVKLRSTHLGLHTTGTRTGGSKGSYEAHAAKDLAYEAKLWTEFDGTTQPKRTGYQAMTRGEYNSARAVLSGGAAPEPAPAPRAARASAEAPAPAPAPTGPAAFSFEATIFDNHYTFGGPTKDAALVSLMGKLRELNFSKIQISDLATGRVCGIDDISHGGKYRMNKQLTAA